MKKNKIEFLDLVIPLVLVYASFLCAYSYFSSHPINDSFQSIMVLSSCSFFFTYGLFAFLRDTKLFGIIWVIKSFGKFTKNKEDKKI